MRNGILTTWALWGLLMVGCNKTEPIGENESGVDNGGLISFSLSAVTEDESIWTKGYEVNDISEVEELQVYSYATAGSWADSDVTPYFTNNILTPFTLTQHYSSWTYNLASQYWPADGRLLSFFAYYPEGELTVSRDEGNRPEYSYTLNPLSRYNDDLLVNARYDLTKANNGDSDLVELELHHALTKITLLAKLKGTNLNPDGVAYSEDYDSYVINGIEFYDIYDNAILSIDEDGTVSWAVSDKSSTDLSSTQGQTLLDVTDPDAILNLESYKSVMLDGQSIFVLPQTLSAVREANGGVAPTAKVRIRRTYYIAEGGDPTEIIYETGLTTIPAPTIAEISGGTGTGCWEAGQHVRYSFEFDIDNLDLYDTPLTISSEVLSWTEAEVVADIHHNLYVYSSLTDIDIDVVDDTKDGDEREYFGEFQICTNYDYNLRVPHHREELGGTITSSRGFLFCSNDFVGTDNNNVGEFTSDGVTYQMFVPTLMSGEDKIVYARALTFDESGTVATANFELLGDPTIYEYKSGYGNTRTEIADMTIDSIVYGSNGYAYIQNSETKLYRLLYIDPADRCLTAFNYTDTYDEYTGTYSDEYHEIVLSNFADDGNTVKFLVEINDEYSFDFSVTRSTRDALGIYTSTAISGDSSYGVNKQGSDPVYTLRLSVDPAHLLARNTDGSWATNEDGISDTEDDDDYYYGSFDDIIGVEMISNGGGMISTYFPVTLTDTDGVITTSANDTVL